MHTLHDDPLLAGVPEVEGYKVLRPCVLLAKVGQGGMASVYRGHHLNLDIDVAVKCLKKSLAEESQDLVTRFQREARLAARINHRNLLHIYDVEHQFGLHYLVMEFVRGESARERVKRKGELGESEALAILLGAARGLAEAHRAGVVHRDVKPDNILVSSDGTVKVADLGLAKAKDFAGSLMTMTGMIMGTPQYMAPEQWGDSSVGPTADVWALGATGYFLLAGAEALPRASIPTLMRRVTTEPFPDITDVRDDVSERTVEFLARCTAQNPKDRFADCIELVAELTELIGNATSELRDKSGISQSNLPAMVSPPPAQALGRIREALSHPTEPPLSLAPRTRRTVREKESESTLPTLPATGVRVPTPPGGTPTPIPAPGRRAPWVAALVVLLLAAASVSAYLLWPRDLLTVYARAEEHERADEWVEAERGYAEVFGTDPDFRDTTNRLALARVRLAEIASRNRDFGGALDLVERAAILPRLSLGTQREVAGCRDVLVPKIESELRQSFELTSPTPGRKLNSRTATIRGTIAFHGIRTIWIDRHPVEDVSGQQFRVTGYPLNEGRNELRVEVALGSVAERFTVTTVILEVDSVRPTLTIDPIKKGTGAGTAMARGKTSEPAKVTLKVGDKTFTAQTALRGAEHQFATAVTLPAGPVRIVAQATDEAGNESEPEQLTATVDPSIPVLSVTSPANGTRVRSPVPVTGTIDHPDTKVVVQLPDGSVRNAEVDGNLRWSATVELPDGEREIVARATNALGNESPAQAITVVVDSTRPKLWVASPTDKAKVAGKFEVRGTIDEPGSVALTLTKGGIQRRESAKVGGDRSFVATLELEPGQVEISAVATDLAGNQSVAASVVVTVDNTVPGVQIASPVEGSRVGARVMLRGTATEPGELRLTLPLGAKRTVPIGADGSFRTELELTSGPREITAVAVDEAGNASAPTTIRVTVDAKPPEVTVTDPPRNATVSGPVTVRGTIDEKGRVAVRIGDRTEPATMAELTWSVALGELPPGKVELLVEAKDEVGNPASTGWSFVVPEPKKAPPPPKVPAWAKVLTPFPDEKVVTDERIHEAIIATGYAWHVLDRKTQIELILIPPGKYFRGSKAGENGYANELPRVEVSIPKAIYVGRYEVTNRQYPGSRSGPGLNSQTQPVVEVSWTAADQFCRRHGVRLLLETEWEYAARAGTDTTYPWGDEAGKGQGWCNVYDQGANPFPGRNRFPFRDGAVASWPVGRGRPNGFGLFDMVGNVSEWCADWYDEKAYSRQGPMPQDLQKLRVIRGGSYVSPPERSRIAYRNRDVPDEHRSHVGFRIARDLD